MPKEPLKPTKTYIHSCVECDNDFDTEQKMDNCPNCNKPFKEVWEHFDYHSWSSHVYRHECKSCKIQFDSGAKEQACPRCKQPPTDVRILAIRDFLPPNTFWGRLARKLKVFLP